MNPPKTFDAVAANLQTSRGELDERKYSSGDEDARVKHRRAVLKLAVSMPESVPAALAWLAAADRECLWISSKSIVQHRQLNTKALRQFTKLAATFAQWVVEADAGLLSQLDDPKATVRAAKLVLSQLHGAPIHVRPLCPSPTKEAIAPKRRSDIARFSTDVALGLVPHDLRSQRAKEAIASGEFTEKQIRIAGFARRLAAQRAYYDKARRDRQKIQNKLTEWNRAKEAAAREVKLAAMDAATAAATREKYAKKVAANAARRAAKLAAEFAAPDQHA